jgi:hypothetical protein
MPGVEQRDGLLLRWFDRSLSERSQVAPMLLQCCQCNLARWEPLP